MRPSLSHFATTIIVGLLVAACASTTSPAPTNTPASSEAPSPAATASPAAMTALPAATAVPSPVVLSPDPAGFAAPIPPDPGATWTGITWRKLAPDDKLEGVQSVTRWAGGYVAVGKVGASRELARTPVWTSADGGAWISLDASAFGPKAIVVGVGETADGLVALTVKSGTNVCDVTDNEPCWAMTGPVQAWTSSDGRIWTAHRGPDIAVPDEVGTYSIIQALTAGRTLTVTLRGQPVARSRDGILWEPVNADALPAGWRGEATVAHPSGLVAVGNAATPVALRSTDGRVWTSHVIQGPNAGIERVVSSLVGGSRGLIAIGNEYAASGEPGDTVSARSPTIWWSSPDGRTWDTLPKYPPLGAMLGPSAQECFDACPDGILVGNGERMFAYRGTGKQVGWTSFDGRSWQPLVFRGSRPSGEPASSDPSSVVVLPMGILLHSLDGSTWFGTPVTK